jgi:hypothetical protein
MNFDIIHKEGTQDCRTAEIYSAFEDGEGCKDRRKIVSSAF